MRRIVGSRLTGRGFTLIEMVIALAIIGLISLLLFSGLRLGSRAWESVEGVSARIGDLRLVDGFLARTLRQLRPAKALFDGTLAPVFAGDSAHLEFAAPLSEHVGISGLYILHLGLEDRASGPALVLTRWYLHPEILEGGDDFPAWTPVKESGIDSLADNPVDMDAAGGAFGRTLLLEDVSHFEIAYYGLADGDSEPDWHDEWLEQSRLPSLIQIRLATETQSWPDLIVALPNAS